MTLFLQDEDFTLHVGDVRDVLRELADETVDCIVTSPPYWVLRDYGVDSQIGLEPTPGAYVRTMVELFCEARRVLARHGTFWLNLGDTYISAPTSEDSGLKQKDLAMIPARVAIALQADGWWLRSENIWRKPNPMTESCTDRTTRSHEVVYQFTKAANYWYDQEPTREEYASADDVAQPQQETLDGLPGESPRLPDGRRVNHVEQGVNSVQHRNGDRWTSTGKNMRSVWTITARPYKDAHFATFPPELPYRCIASGCPAWVCRTCGEPRSRMFEKVIGVLGERKQFVGWSDCGHDDYRRGVVLDPFMGSGTTAIVARELGRHVVGIELNEEYAREQIVRRTQQMSLLTT